MKRLVLAAAVLSIGCIEPSPAPIAEPVVPNPAEEAPAASSLRLEKRALPVVDHVVTHLRPAALWKFPGANVKVVEGDVIVRTREGDHPDMDKYKEVLSHASSFGKPGVLQVETEEGITRLEIQTCDEPNTPNSIVQDAYDEFLGCLSREESPMKIGHLMVRVAFDARGYAKNFSVSPWDLSDETKTCIGQVVYPLKVDAAYTACQMHEGGAVF